MRKIIIEKTFIGFSAMREDFDLGDSVSHGNTELEALECLLLMEETTCGGLNNNV